MESLDGFWWDPKHPEMRWPGTLRYGGPEGANLKLLLEPTPLSADRLRQVFNNDVQEYDFLLGDAPSGEQVTLLKAFNRSTDYGVFGTHGIAQTDGTLVEGRDSHRDDRKCADSVQ